MVYLASELGVTTQALLRVLEFPSVAVSLHRREHDGLGANVWWRHQHPQHGVALRSDTARNPFVFYFADVTKDSSGLRVEKSFCDDIRHKKTLRKFRHEQT